MTVFRAPSGIRALRNKEYGVDLLFADGVVEVEDSMAPIIMTLYPTLEVVEHVLPLTDEED